MSSNKLRLSKSNRMVGGVCGGLGSHLGLDPTLLRLVFIFALILWGIGPLLYILLWLFLYLLGGTEKAEEQSLEESKEEEIDNAN